MRRLSRIECPRSGRRTFGSTMSGPAFSLLVAATIAPIVSGTVLAWMRFR